MIAESERMMNELEAKLPTGNPVIDRLIEATLSAGWMYFDVRAAYDAVIELERLNLANPKSD